MTTGRINQVTIVRRGWPPAPMGARRRDFQVTGGRPWTGRAARGGLRRVAVGAAGGNPLPPSKPPRADRPPRAQSPPKGRSAAAAWGPRRRRTRRVASAMAASTARGCLPLLREVASPEGQPPTRAHSTASASGCEPANTTVEHPPIPVKPGRPVARGGRVRRPACSDYAEAKYGPARHPKGHGRGRLLSWYRREGCRPGSLSQLELDLQALSNQRRISASVRLGQLASSPASLTYPPTPSEGRPPHIRLGGQ